MDRPGPSHSTASATAEIHSLTGMRAPATILEWQLQAVLYRAKLTQYFETFISQGGDDIEQLMECDENEFLEIMSFVGMTSKPLHVRRLQRTLNEFSKNREAFLQESIQHIGPPPVQAIPNPADALRALLAQPLQGQFQRSQPLFTDSPSTSFRLPFPSLSIGQSTPVASTSLAALPSTDILAIVSGVSMSTQQPVPISLASMLLSSPSTCTTPVPTLPDADIEKLRSIATIVLKSRQEDPSVSQRKPTKEVQSAMLLPVDHPDRISKFRQLSAIYGRSDAKRKPHKQLTHHELLVNEAATQICLQQVDFLARRNDLFALARQVSRLSGLEQHRVRDMDARQLAEHSVSPSIRSTPTPDEIIASRSHTASVESKQEPESSRPTKRRHEESSSELDPKIPK